MKQKNLEIAKFLLKIEKKTYKKFKKLEIKVKNKGKGHDLVTSLDFANEKYILAQLAKHFPNVKVVSEELNTKVQATGTFFCVDPLDGTVNFANKFPLWGIQIAYVENDELVASAIFIPIEGGYYAAKGCGAFKNGKRFFVKEKSLQHCLINLGNVEAEVGVAKALYSQSMQYRHLGSACMALAYMAEGRFGIYIVNNSIRPWDFFPGLLLTQEAGCVMKEIDNLFVIVNNEKNLEAVEKLVKKF